MIYLFCMCMEGNVGMGVYFRADMRSRNKYEFCVSIYGLGELPLFRMVC